MPPRLGAFLAMLRRARPGLLAALFGFVALATWAVASPVGSSPDEDYHLASIWCGGGERAGYCELPAEKDATANSRMVPAILVGDAACFAYKPDVSAACQRGLNDLTLSETTRGNFTGTYPPVFYAVMSIFVGPNIAISVVAMRLFNVALFVLMLTAITWLTPARRREAVVLPVLVTLVPLSAFLIASINPSGWALLSASTLWISLYNYFEASGARRWLFAAFAVLAVVVGAGARADAAAYAGLAIAGVLILKFQRGRRFWLSALLPVGLAVLAVVFYRSAGQSAAAADGLSSPAPTAGNFVAEFFQDLPRVPDLWAGMLGHWGLGWLDTTMPGFVWVAALAVFAATVFFGLTRGGLRKYVALGLMFAAFWGVPTWLQVQTHAPVGAYVQPRYILPLGILLVAFALLSSGLTASTRLSVSQVVVMGLALCGANALGLHENMRRYVTGQDVADWNLSSNIEWWWPVGPSPMWTWVIGSIAFGLCLAILARLAWSAGLIGRQTQAANEE